MDNQNNKTQIKKIYGKLLLIILLLAFSIEYYVFVFEVILNCITPENFYYIIAILTIFHFLILLFLLAFFSTMGVNPGNIPQNWEDHRGDNCKRYCTICKCAKPDRSHHCSICNKCILNMDFHCLFMDNCIGFYNRKYYIQSLLFASFLTIFVDITELYLECNNILRLLQRRETTINGYFKIYFVVIWYLINFTASIFITKSLISHINLVLINSTVVESFYTEEKALYKKFNLTQLENWEQVFGKNKLFWFFPIPIKKGRPDGDGITWRTNDKKHNE